MALLRLLLLFAATVDTAVPSEVIDALSFDDRCDSEGCGLKLVQRRSFLLGECSKAGEGCLKTKCCVDGYQCYAKDQYWADCRTSCVLGVHSEDPPTAQTPWSCKILNTTGSSVVSSTVTSTPAPRKAALESLVPQGPECSAPGQDCRSTGCCTDAAMECYEKNKFWASCKRSCAAGEKDPSEPNSEETWSCARYIYNNRVPAPKSSLQLNTSNPFEGHPFFVNPVFQANVQKSVVTAVNDTARKALKSIEKAPTATWVDKRSKISGTGPDSMEGVLAQAASKDPPEMVVFIVYDLPNRDCSANASAGELCCNDNCDFSAGDCLFGLSRYVTEFIDPIAELLRRYADLVPVALVLEPDSLANLATNSAEPRCGSSSTRTAYIHGIRYAVQAISKAAGNVALYLDAGNSGWLGWKEQMSKYVEVVRELGVADRLRGFASNVANYNALGVMCPTYDWCLNNSHATDACCFDPCKQLQDYNPSVNEHNYALHLVTAMSDGIPGFTPHVIIDTSRNGALLDHTCHSWCNPRGAGAGKVATSSTANQDIVDAYFWLKTPGESDGCTEFLPDGSRCARFDSHCGSSKSMGNGAGESGAPEAGRWYDMQAEELAANAQLT